MFTILSIEYDHCFPRFLQLCVGKTYQISFDTVLPQQMDNLRT